MALIINTSSPDQNINKLKVIKHSKISYCKLLNTRCVSRCQLILFYPLIDFFLIFQRKSFKNALLDLN